MESRFIGGRMKEKDIKVGSLVVLRDTWGAGQVKKVIVQGFGEHKGFKVFDYNNNRWAYMDQITRVVKY